MDKNGPKKCGMGDLIKVGPPVGPNGRLFVRHTADHGHITGIMRPVREGEMLTGNEFHLEPKDEANGIFSVTPLSEEVQAAIRKPSKIVTPAYREGWDAIFGKQDVGEA